MLLTKTLKVFLSGFFLILLPFSILFGENPILYFGFDSEEELLQTSEIETMNDLLRLELLDYQPYQFVYPNAVQRRMMIAEDIDRLADYSYKNGINWILYGKVKKAFDEIVVSVVVIDAETGKTYSELYQSSDEISKIPDSLEDIAESVHPPEKIRRETPEPEEKKLTVNRDESTESTSAEELFGKAKDLLNRDGTDEERLENHRKALKLIEDAILLDQKKSYIHLRERVYDDIDRLESKVKSQNDWDRYWIRREAGMHYSGIAFYASVMEMWNGFIDQHYSDDNPYYDFTGAGIQLDLGGKHLIWYNRFTYYNFYHTAMRNPSAVDGGFMYMTDYQTGLKAHQMFFTVLDCYLFGGGNYFTIYEGAWKDSESVMLMHSRFGYHAGAGMKIMLTSEFGLYGEAQVNLPQFNSISVDHAQYSIGVFY